MIKYVYALQSTLAKIGGRLNAPKVFLFFSIFWGIPMVFLTPPYHVPDEPGCFMRAYQLSEGNLVSEIQGDSLGGDLPVVHEEFYNIWAKTVTDPETRVGAEDFNGAFKLPSKIPERKFMLFPTGAFHSPVTYFPQALGVFIGRILNLPLLVSFYLGRLANLIVWIMLFYFAIQAIPVLKWWLVVLALSPMNVFLAASLSGDALTNGVAFLFMSLILKNALTEHIEINTKSFTLLTVLGVMLALLKNAYVPIALLWFLIPKSAFAGKRDFFIKSGLFFGLIFIVYSANALYLNHLLNTLDYENLSGKIIGMHVVNPHKQLAFVLENPLKFIGIAIHSYWESRGFIISSYGGTFGWLQHKMPDVIIYFVIFVQLVLALTNAKPGIILPARKKAVIALAFAGVIAAFSLLMYVQFNQVANPVIINLQGRYFIPAVPLLLLLFYNHKLFVKEVVMKWVAIGAVLIFQIFTVLTTLKAFYV